MSYYFRVKLSNDITTARGVVVIVMWDRDDEISALKMVFEAREISVFTLHKAHCYHCGLWSGRSQSPQNGQ